MPLHDVGYREWQGKTSGDSFRWWVIAWTGIRIAWKNMWLRRMLIAAWLPAAAFGSLFFFYEQAVTESINNDMTRMFVVRTLEHRLNAPQEIVTALRQDPIEARHTVWSYLLLVFFRNPQGVMIVLLVGLIAPRLISQDLRSRAHLLYFSRPLTATDYILGKLTVLWVFLIAVTTLPALALYVLGVLLSPDLSVVGDTWDIPLRILVASVALILPTSLLALAISSLTKESRYAGFAWFVIWVLGSVTYNALTSTANIGIRDLQAIDMDRWVLVSPYHILGRAQAWIFAVDVNVPLARKCVVLICVTVVFSWILLRSRIASVVRA